MTDPMEPDFAFKFILLGDTSVGKSCIIMRFRDSCFTTTHNSTVGVTFSSHRMLIGGCDLQFQVWDTAGQEIYRSITRSYYRESDCAILVCDLTNPESFAALTGWVHDIRTLAPEKCKIVISGNKVDLPRQVSHEDLVKFAEQIGVPVFETSALTGVNVQALFEEAAMLAYTSAIQARELRTDTTEEGTESRVTAVASRREHCC
jgi:Ras-related protein Rab-2A